jgi:hypothetical protein
MTIGSITRTLIELGVLLLIEGVALFIAQRQLLRLAVNATGSRLLSYLLVMQGTVVHEAAHYIACRILRVPAGRQLRTSSALPATP